jgi:uncharacterized protein YjiS (DUF1127 family)
MRIRRTPAPESLPPAPAAPPTARAVRRALPPAGQLRRERRGLLQLRETRLRDLGGLMLEMYRRDQFKQDLLIEQCLEVISIEERLREIDELLEASAQQRREGVGVRCTCGAPIQFGTHFCGNCGRPVGEEPVVSCPNCGHALPADAQFCANCGTPAPSASGGDGNGQDDAQTMYQQAEQRSGDSWEG